MIVSEMMEDCPKCGGGPLIWWSKGETESHIEVYMNCEECGHEFPKIPVSKTEDTSDDANEQRLVDRYL